jgi:SAM-dependent methyltransferase
MDLSDLAANIKQGEHGIWISRTRSAISYPEAGNDLCFEIEDRSFWFHHRNRCLLEVMTRFPPLGTFVDIGGGNGFVALALENAGRPVIVIEPGPRGAANARRRGLRHVVCSTLEDVGFGAGTLSAAGAFDVIEHIQDDLSFVRSLAHSLAPMGRLYLTVPAFPWLWSHEDDFAGHYRRYTTATLRHLLEQCGFQVEYMTYFFQFLPLPVFCFRTIPYKLRLRHHVTDIDRARTDHEGPGGPLKYLLDGVLNRELALIRSGRTIPFGGSCLSVARKL